MSKYFQIFFKQVFSTGASKLVPTLFSKRTGPLFLSSLDCSETDQSLLDDCSHDQLGLASCDDDFGLATVKCFGNIIHFQDIFLTSIIAQMLMNVLKTLTTAVRTVQIPWVVTCVSATMVTLWTLICTLAMVCNEHSFNGRESFLTNRYQ